MRNWKWSFILVLAFLLKPMVSAEGANTIHVPADQPTIQAAINAAVNGDTVLVAPGTYYENINFNGKAITVTSSGGPSMTTIDGRSMTSVVKFNSSEGLSSVLSGFTITHGYASEWSGYDGGGMLVSHASPTISGNIVTGNTVCDSGAGIAVESSSAVIQGNTITNNSQQGCDGGPGGGGIFIGGAGSAQIVGNVITNNRMLSGGGGIGLNAAGTPTIANNLISGNSAAYNWGGGVETMNDSDANIIQNVIIGNSITGAEAKGGGVACLVPSGTRGCFLIGNTIANNTSSNPGGEVYLSGYDSQVQVINNIIVDNSAQGALDCDNTYPGVPSTVAFNDVYNTATGPTFMGGCASYAGSNGNISLAPRFFDLANRNVHLLPGSPAIDVGTNSAPGLSATDFDANPRLQNGTVDMGAFEYFPTTATVAPTSIAFANQDVSTTSSSQPATVTNTGSNPLLLDIAIAGDFVQTNNCGTAVPVGANCTINVSFAPTVRGVRNGSLTITSNTTSSPNVVSLSGTGTGPVASLSVSTLSFGNQDLGTTSTAEAVTVTNSGEAALAFTSITATGEFGETDNCAGGVAPGGSCTASVTFTPTALGPAAGALKFYDNAADTPQTVALTGTGIPQPVAANVNIGVRLNTPVDVTLSAIRQYALPLTFSIVTGPTHGSLSAVTPLTPNSASVTYTPNAGFSGRDRFVYAVTDPDGGFGTAIVNIAVGVNPVPQISQPLVPAAAAPGGGDFALTVNGTGFVSGAVVNWQQDAVTTLLATTFVSSTVLTATVPAANIASPGTARISVSNPGVSVASNVVFFPVASPNAATLFAGAPGSPIGTGLDSYAYPSDVAVADFNGDGKLDMAVVNDGNYDVTILLGNGDGTFSRGSSPVTEIYPTMVAIGDFTGDGKPDLAVTTVGTNRVTILIGKGDGTFTPAASSPAAGPGPFTIAVGDFNADGRLDLAVANAYSNTLTILLGNGDGTFTAADSSPSTGIYPVWMGVGDFNSDGFLDLAVANQGSSTVTILLGKGDGTFTHTASPLITGNSPWSVEVGDFNSDGKLDLAVADVADGVKIFLGNADGTFTSTGSAYSIGDTPYMMEIGDLNADGKLDLAVVNDSTNNVKILLGKGDGTFALAGSTPASGSGAGAVAIGDFDGDGRLDLAVANEYSNTVSVMLQLLTSQGAWVSLRDLSFADQNVGTTSAAQLVTLTNSGSATLNISSIISSANFGQTNNCGASLSVNASCTINVTFSPTATGRLTGALTITDDSNGVAESTQTVSLTGIGTIPPPILSPGTLSFPNQPVGTSSAVLTETVTNASTVNLQISTVTIGYSNASDFAESADTCTGVTLTPNTACTVSVTFTPLAIGTRTASLVITDNSGGVSGSTQTVSLSGTGLAAPTNMTMTGSAVTYGTAGVVTVSVTSVGGTVNGNVSLTVDSGTPLTQPLANGQAVFTISGLAAGSHTLNASYSAQGNFLASSASGSLQVNTVPLTITASSATVAYGGAVPAITPSYSGFVNGDGASNLTTPPTCSTTATSQSPVGSYPSTCSGAVAANYAINYVPGTVTISASVNTPTFLALDTTTQGNWKGVYGADGHNVINDTVAYPSYVTVTPSGQGSATWAASTTDSRALLKANSGTDRIAATWYSGTSLLIDMVFSDGLQHRLAVYCLDWDTTVRSERIDILDVNGAVLNTQNVSNFHNGQYLVWQLGGHVQVRVTNTNGNANGVISGLFFDPSGPAPVKVSVNPSSATLTPNGQQPFTATVTGTSNTAVTWNMNPSVGTLTANGLYTAPETILATQTITITATSAADDSKTGTATVTLNPMTTSSGTAAFLALDATTQGNWKGVYGADGYNVFNDTVAYPGYVTVTPSGQGAATWAPSTGDARALLKVNSSTDRIAATWYTGSSLLIDLPFTDGLQHRLTIYCLDWDTTVRSERIDILDTNGVVLNTQNVSSFHNGQYLVWQLGGHVQVRVTNTNGSANAVISGMFFDPSGLVPVAVSVNPSSATLTANGQQQFSATVTGTSNTGVTWSMNPSVGTLTANGLYTAPGTISSTQTVTITATSVADGSKTGTAMVTLNPASTSSGTATFVALDTATQGNWKGVYGADGYNVFNDTVAYPAFVTVTPSGQGSATWAASTTDARAPLKANSSTDRIAATWYTGTSLLIDMAFTDGQQHSVAVYCLDWDTTIRSERIDILDANGVVLNTQNVSSFHNGQYLVWQLSGHVQIRMTNTASSANGVISGLFFR